jgi:hypothetical protein
MSLLSLHEQKCDHQRHLVATGGAVAGKNGGGKPKGLAAAVVGLFTALRPALGR